MHLFHHLNLLLRSERSLRLKAALEHVVKPGDRVLDAGCGTGLLSMFAALAGAGRVVGVDLADLAPARALIEENQLADRIDLVRGDLRDLEFPDRFDVVVAMIYINDPRRDEAQTQLAGQIYRHFLKAGGEPIPDQVHYAARGVAWPAQSVAARWRRIEQDCRSLESFYQLKLGALATALRDEIEPTHFPRRLPSGMLDRGGATPLTDEAPAMKLDYREGSVEYPPAIELTATSAGALDAVVWRQELRHRGQLLFANESISWVEPSVTVSPGATCSLALDDRWRASNVLTPLAAPS